MILRKPRRISRSGRSAFVRCRRSLRNITLFHKEKYHLLRLMLDRAEAVSEKFTGPATAEHAAINRKGAAVTCTSVTREKKREQPPKLYDLTRRQTACSGTRRSRPWTIPEPL